MFILLEVGTFFVGTGFESTCHQLWLFARDRFAFATGIAVTCGALIAETRFDYSVERFGHIYYCFLYSESKKSRPGVKVNS